MKAALLSGLRQIEIGEVPEPQVRGPRDVLLRIDAVGVAVPTCTITERGASEQPW